MSIWMTIKKNLPVTSDAAEYEAQRLLRSIGQLDAAIGSMAGAVSARQDELEARLGKLEQRFAADGADLRSRSQELERELGAVRETLERSEQRLAEAGGEAAEKLQGCVADIAAALEALLQGQSATREEIRRSDLYSIAGCRTDGEFDQKLIPLNRFFKGRGMALSMHLTSVDGTPDDIVYETADLVRTSALWLAADEVKRRDLPGETAELGVAEGKFAAVIDALFPGKKLYLFDTFKGFPEADLEYDKENRYSDQKPGFYGGVDLGKVLGRMRTPEDCVVRKGWFPDTAQGLEEQFCFVSIDCDLYKPIYAGLDYFYPRLVKNGYIFVHDYRSRYYRGVKDALSQFAQEHGISYTVLPDNTGTAVITK